MTREPVPLQTLLDARERLVAVLHALLAEEDRAFLLSVKGRKPDWSLIDLPGIADLPVVRWKLVNLVRMSDAMHAAALDRLRQVLGRQPLVLLRRPPGWAQTFVDRQLQRDPGGSLKAASPEATGSRRSRRQAIFRAWAARAAEMTGVALRSGTGALNTAVSWTNVRASSAVSVLESVLVFSRFWSRLKARRVRLIVRSKIGH